MSDKKKGAHASAQSKTEHNDSRIIFGGVALCPGVNFLIVRHANDCPAIFTQSEADCVCSPVMERVSERKFLASVRQTRAQRRWAEREAKKATAKARGQA